MLPYESINYIKMKKILNPTFSIRLMMCVLSALYSLLFF